MKRPCQSNFDTQGDDYMVSSPETSSGQAIWQMKTNNKHMKRPCQIDFDTQGDDYFSMVSSIWQLKNK
ncbi:hypothetical protein [Labilibaculum manganireducens]|uniref:hypothetical protein n=1 Tax=Labilibaculum manganireducens TaxID=1940525 RepID=UPI0029F54569|nr:hypothetical protein [Labilibaculum manganireducens]